MNMQKILVCDRDERVLNELAKMIKAYMGADCEIAVYQDSDRMLADMKREKSLPAMVFIDLNFGKNSGVETAKEIMKRHEEMPIVFTSEKPRNVQDIFAVEPVYFLEKPIQGEALAAALERGKKRICQIEEKCVTISSRGVLHRVRCDRIYYAESSKRIISMIGRDEKWVIYMKMDDLETILPECFLRCHKSYMVNMNHITSLSAEGAILEGGKKIPVSRAKYREAKRRFWEYFNGTDFYTD